LGKNVIISEMKSKTTTKKIIKLKKPQLRFPILTELQERFSPRVFSSKKISEAVLNSVFEAARWAPSGYNHQPWYFYWTRQGRPAYGKIISCLSERNHWAKTAPVLIVCCYIKECEHGVNRFAGHDLGAAVMSMIIQAQSCGIYSRQMGLFDGQKLQKSLNIPKGYVPFVIVATGKPGDYTTINEELLARELNKRERKKDIVKKL
jgi:nitroreductase